MIVDCDWNPWVFVSSRTFSFDMLGSPNCMGNNIFVVPRDSLPMKINQFDDVVLLTMLPHGNSGQATVGTRSRLNGKPTDAVRDWLVIYLYPISLEMVIFLFLGQDSEIPEKWPICLCFFTQMFVPTWWKSRWKDRFHWLRHEKTTLSILYVFFTVTKTYSRKDETKQIPCTMTYITKPSFP